MRFAVATVDRYQVVLDAFVEAGWELVKIFSTNHLGPRDSNAGILGRAERLRVPIQLSRIMPGDLEALAKAGCSALIVAGHPWRIPDWRPYLPYAVNFHPSPLPEARGPYPQCRAIRERRREWGVSCHKIEAEFDTGDVLGQMPFAMHEQETHETLDLKVQIGFAQLALDVAGALPTYWNNATPQIGGSYWHFDSDADRTLDFTRPVEEILLAVRACGTLETITQLDNRKVYVTRANGWQQPHRFTPGTIIHRSNGQLVVAAADGLVALLDWRADPRENRRAQYG